jgi:predicted dehydrogenase
MLDAEELDAAVVLVEPDRLCRVVLDCLDRGLHVLMEKPPGITAFQTATLARAAAAADRILMVAFNRRYVPLVAEAVRRVRAVAPITQVAGRFMKRGSAAFARGTVPAFDSDTVHVVDGVRWIAGAEPERAATIEGRYGDVVPNAWNAVVCFANGVTGVIASNYRVGGRIHTFEVHAPGASAFINLGMGGQECEADVLIARDDREAYSLSAVGALNHEMVHLDGKDLAGEDDFAGYYGFLQEDRAFVACVREGRSPSTSIADAVKTMEFVKMLRASRI